MFSETGMLLSGQLLKKLLETLLLLDVDVMVQPCSPSCWPF